MTDLRRRRFTAALYLCTACLIIQTASIARAHPMVENGLDVVIAPAQITIDARISPEELCLIESPGTLRIPAEQRATLIQQHASYVARHLRISADNHGIEAASVEFVSPVLPAGQESSANSLLNYRLRYNLAAQPDTVRIEQNFLSELPAWSATCVLRIRQAGQSSSNADTALLSQDKTAEFSCQWPQANATSEESAVQPGSADVHANARIRKAILASTAQGIIHFFAGCRLFLLIITLALGAPVLWRSHHRRLVARIPPR